MNEEIEIVRKNKEKRSKELLEGKIEFCLSILLEIGFCISFILFFVVNSFIVFQLGALFLMGICLGLVAIIHKHRTKLINLMKEIEKWKKEE